MGFSIKEKKKELLTVKHPLYTEDESVKLPYLICIALLMARVDDDLAQSEREALTELIYGLDLPEGRLEKVLTKVKDTDDSILDEILPVLTSTDIRYAFVLDLYKAANADREFKDKECVFISDIMEMMQLSAAETEFLNLFGVALMTNDLKSANSAVQTAIEQKLEPNIKHLQFFLPEFSYEEELAGFTLGAHETRVIIRPATLSQGNWSGIFSVALAGINTKPDTTKDTLMLGAAIFASKLLILKRCNFMENFSESAAGAVYSGEQLHMTDCVFKGCSTKGIGGALVVHGEYSIKDSKFEGCSSQLNGGAMYVCGGSHEKSSVKDCTISKCATTKSGGGIFINEVKYSITKCKITSCSAGESGGGLATDKYDQCPSEIKQCVFDGCTASKGGGTFIKSYDRSNYTPDTSGTTYKDCLPDGYKNENRGN